MSFETLINKVKSEPNHLLFIPKDPNYNENFIIGKLSKEKTEELARKENTKGMSDHTPSLLAEDALTQLESSCKQKNQDLYPYFASASMFTMLVTQIALFFPPR